MAPVSRDELAAVGRLVEGVGGWLEDAEGELLYQLARGCRGRGAIVEIGSWMGRSTIWLASGARAAGLGPVFAIDPHVGSAEHRNELGGRSTLEIFRENIRAAGLEDVVEAVVATSAEAGQLFDNSVELVFIDGDHEYEPVTRDFETWFPKVVPGGVMAFHDAGPRVEESVGARRLVSERVERSGAFYPVGSVHRLVYARKLGAPWPGRRALVLAALAARRRLPHLQR